MERVFRHPTDDPRDWPVAVSLPGIDRLWQGDDEIAPFKLGRRIIDRGLDVVWGNDQRYWEPGFTDNTSPRGSCWRLKLVFWLHVKTVVHISKPGLYAAFFRVRVRNSAFRANWGAGNGACNFLESQRAAEGYSQPSDVAASWSHDAGPRELIPLVDDRGWYLVHLGNIVVPARSDRGGVGSSQNVCDANDPIPVPMFMGGENPYGVHGLYIDYAALAPIRLSWKIVRVLLIGQKKRGGEVQTSAVMGNSRTFTYSETVSSDRAVAHGSGEDKASYESGRGAGAVSNTLRRVVGRIKTLALGVEEPSTSRAKCSKVGGPSPLLGVPDEVLSVIIEYSQPTLARGPDEDKWTVF
ncbi:unnamed protein product [Discosporangium mesarthrocarpum]